MVKRSDEAAYFIVDLTKLPPEVRDEVYEDASLGGGAFGVRVVEIIHNGPAASQIFGVYKGADEAKWNEYLAENGVSVDAEIDPADATRVAKSKADSQAEAENARQDEAIEAIAGPAKRK